MITHPTKENNFDFIRLLFSSLVIFSHSYALTGTSDEPLEKLTQGQTGTGGIAVDCFFIISGYLIFISLRNSRSVKNYIWKRTIRIFPGLFFMLLFTMVLIPFVYKGDNIFAQKDYYMYFLDNLTFFKFKVRYYFIEHVFENVPYPKAINGSLWSLPYEFFMYFFMLIFYFIRQHKNKLLYGLIIIFFVAYLMHIYRVVFLDKQLSSVYLIVFQLNKLMLFFLAGSILSLFPLQKINKIYIKVSLLLLIIVSFYFHIYTYTTYFFLPILVILCGISFSKYLNYIPKKIGDISYGVYIYGFLIQQTLMNYFLMNVLELTLYSLLIVFILSFASWHLVEKKALAYKNLL